MKKRTNLFLDEKTSKLGKVLAFKRGTSLSKMVGELLDKEIQRFLEVKETAGGKTTCSISIDFTETLKARRDKSSVHTK